MGVKYVGEAMYHTPTGFITTEDEGATEAEVTAKVEGRCQFGLISLVYLAIHEKRGEGADGGAEGGGREPAAPGEEVLAPEVVAPGEHDEAPGDLDPPCVAGHDDLRAGGRLVVSGTEDKSVMIVGKGDEVEVVELAKHRLLVDGPVRVLALKAPLDVAGLARMLSDLEEVPGEVGLHGSMGVGAPFSGANWAPSF